jgi:predicted nuclease with TOPRIM domain
MIYKEELRKAEVEKKKLQKEYEDRIAKLKKELSVLKERIGAQEDMLRRVVDYASDLEKDIDQIQSRVDTDVLRNSNGFH